MTLNSIVPSDDIINKILNAVKTHHQRLSYTSPKLRFYSYRNYIILLTMKETGFRISEVLSLFWKDVDFKKHTVRVRAENEKENRDKTLYLKKSFVNQLQDYKKRSFELFGPSELVFFSKKGKNRRMKNTGFIYSLHVILRRANQNLFDKYNFLGKNGKKYSKVRITHGFRSWRFTKWVKENPSLRLFELQQLTFHKSTDVLMNYYLEVDRERIQKNVICKQNFLLLELTGDVASRFRRLKKTLGFSNDSDFVVNLLEKVKI